MNRIKKNRQNAFTEYSLTCLLALLVFAFAFSPAFAVGEDNEETDASDVETEEITDEYIPSEYRLANDNINEWEDRVLIAATGQLTSEGRVYYAYGDYVDELVSYFVRKDLDLSEEEAMDAIEQINDPNNAKMGARAGYLYQIGGKPKDADSIVENAEYDGELYPEFDESVRFKNESEYRKSSLYLNNKAYIQDRTSTVYESKSAMRKEMKKIAAADREYQKILSKRPADAAITELVMPKTLGIVFFVVAAALFVLTIAVVINAWRKGAIAAFRSMDDERWQLKSSGKHRHRIRQTSAAILAIVFALDMTAVFAGLTFNSTFGSDRYIEEAMDRGGICQHGYMDFRDDVHSLLLQNSLPQNSLDLALTYRDYRFDYMKGTRSAIKSCSADVTYRGIQDSVEGQLDLMAYVANKDSSKVVSGVNRLFEESMSTDIGVFISRLRSSVKPFYLAGFIISFLGLVIAGLALAIQRNDVYRGIRNLSEGVIGGTLLWGLMTAYMKFMLDAFAFGIKSDSVYVMFVEALQGVSSYMIMLLCISAAVAAILFAVSVIMRRRSY